jgi:TRAP-type C4-dicarboxylate transport system substrate-binding protein
MGGPKRLTRLVSIVAVILVSLGIAGPASADIWRYAHEEYKGDVQDVFAQNFKTYIEEHSDHKIQIYRFGKLGESDDILEQAQAGVLQFVNQSPGFTGALIPETQIFFIPYVMPTDMDTVVRFFRQSKAINETFPKLYAKKGLKLLQMYPEGEMVVTADEPVTRPSDFKGKKIRVMTNPLLSATYKAFGATPTPLPWGEVYGALQTHMIQGQENPIFWIESGRLYEVSPNLIFTRHGWFTTAMMANKTFFDNLPPGDKQLVRSAADYAFGETIKHIDGLSERALRKIRKASPDVTVTRLNPAQIERFKKRASRVERKFIDMTGDSGRKLLEQFHSDLQNLTSP